MMMILLRRVVPSSLLWAMRGVALRVLDSTAMTQEDIAVVCGRMALDANETYIRSQIGPLTLNYLLHNANLVFVMLF